MAVKQCYSGGKLSSNKKSISVFRNRNLYLTIAAVYLLACVSAADAEASCSNVKNVFEKNGILSATDIVSQPNSDAGALCPNMGCCAASSRAKLTSNARGHLEGLLRRELTKLADILAHRAKKFDSFFKALLQQSREEFHAMFKRTYGMIYEQHSYVFQQLFDQLETYYARGDIDFDVMIENFFSILYQKMFTVLNSQYTFDEKYLRCVSEHMRETQPFDNVPNNLSTQLRRAFVATRTYHKALRAGAEVVKTMIQVPVTPECIESWSRLQHCPTCGDVRAAPCSRYCLNVLRGCLAAHADLSQQWEAYVDALEKVGERLLGPFNIVMVVEPIDIKISEAIMNFQEHNQEISQKIFSRCGKPVLGGAGGAGPFFSPDRTKRFVRSVLPDLHWNEPSDVDDFEIEASLESLVKEDPMLYSLNSKEDIDESARVMAEKAKERQKFLQYLRDDMDAEEYEERERRRRNAEPEPARGQFNFEKKKNKKPPPRVDSGRDIHEWGSPALERNLKETRTLVQNSRRYWSGLPYLLCNRRNTAQSPCYNGTHEAQYTLPLAGEGSAGLASNPEVLTSAHPAPATSGAAAAARDAARALTQRLKEAYNGEKVHWTAAEEIQSSATIVEEDFTSTAGSGSGDDAYGPPDDDEDRDMATNYSGSGEGPTSFNEDTDSDVITNVPKMPDVPNVPFMPNIPSVMPDINNTPGPISPVVPPKTFVPTQSRNIPEPTNEDDASPTTEPSPPIREQPATDSAPQLQKALFTYALPVVCAWFGTIVTDLF